MDRRMPHLRWGMEAYEPFFRGLDRQQRGRDRVMGRPRMENPGMGMDGAARQLQRRIRELEEHIEELEGALEEPFHMIEERSEAGKDKRRARGDRKKRRSGR